MTDEVHAVAITIYRMGDRSGLDVSCGFWLTKDNVPKMLRILDEQAADAAAKAESYRKGIAFRAALDAIMPGWFYVDASDHLPEHLWGTFVSDSVDEWVDWLVGHGVDEDIARELSEAAAPEVPDGR